MSYYWDGEDAILCDPKYGPSFGRDQILISSGSNENSKSFAEMQGGSGTFKHETLEYDCMTKRAEEILAGSLTFQTEEIEVYAKIN